jgi:hypothetical protein
MDAWRKVVARTPAPKEGCFTVTFPDTAWTEEPCAPAVSNPLPAPPRHFPRAEAKSASAGQSHAGAAAGGQAVPAVGNGTDWSAQTTSAILSATGSFPFVSGVGTESSADGNNAYSLQINTNSFPSSTCSGGAAGCQALMQVVFYGQSGNADIWYVLQPYNSGNGNCPAGWQSNGTNCYLEESKYQVNIGAQPASNLQALSLGTVVGSPNITMSISAGGATYKSVGVPNLIGLSSAWTDAEFNVFGDGGGDTANFTGTPTIQVQTEVQTASSPGLSCANTRNTNSATVETNSLNLVPNCCLASGNAITFLESGVANQPCTLCGGHGQTCCSAGTGCSSPTDICQDQTQGGEPLCVACGGDTEPCCSGNTCSVTGDSCVLPNNPVGTQGFCGQPNALVASPNPLSVAMGDGSNPLNTVSTTFSASGFWTHSGALSVAPAALPQGVHWNDQNFPTVVLSADMTAEAGPQTIPVTGYIGGYSVSLDLHLNVTPCSGHTCEQNGWECGSFDNGCGATTTCGMCSPGDYCVAGHCSICNETTCPPLEVWYPAPRCACGPCPCGNVKVGGQWVCKVCG